MWDLIEKYQTLIAGSFAVVAAAIGLYAIYWQTSQISKERDRNRRLHLANDRSSLLSAFESEISSILFLIRVHKFKAILKNQITRASEQLPNSSYKPDEFISVKSNYMRIYEENASKIGLLGPVAAKTTVLFYANSSALIEQINHDAAHLEDTIPACTWVKSLETALENCKHVQCYGFRAVKDIRIEMRKLKKDTAEI